MNTKLLLANHLTLRSRTGLLMLAAVMLAALPAPWLPAAKSAAPGKTQRLDSPDQTPEGLSKSDWTSIRAAYEARRHAFMPIEGGWQARNPGQQWTTKFDGRGFLATPREGAWTWGLELRSYGFGEKQAPVGVRAPQVKAEGQRLTYQWDATVQEWWGNDPRGLEHGYVIHQRPPEPRSSGRESAPSELSEKSEPTHVGCYSSGPESSLSFILATRGNLKPRVNPDGLGVLFQDATGATVLNYTGLKVWDADGKRLPSRFEMDGSQPSTLNSQPAVRLVVAEQGARYPIVIDPIAQQAYLKSENNGGPLSDDHFGYSVAVSGDTVVVGSPLEDSSTTGVNSTPDEGATGAGAAYVFTGLGPAPSPRLSIVASGPARFTLSWAPPTAGFALQESLSLSAVGWSNSPSGATNPITLPTAGLAKLFRLFKP